MIKLAFINFFFLRIGVDRFSCFLQKRHLGKSVLTHLSVLLKQSIVKVGLSSRIRHTFLFIGIFCKTIPCSLDSRKRRRRWAPPVFPKKRRRLLPFIPHEDCGRRLKEMSSLASALTASQMEFCDDLYYSPGLAPRSANQAKIERGGMQVLCTHINLMKLQNIQFMGF